MNARSEPAIRAVLFDWGDTLVRYPGFSTDEDGHRHAVDACFAWLAAEAHTGCITRFGIDRERFAGAYRDAARAQFAEMARTGVDQSMALRLGDTLARAGCTCDLPRAMLDRVLDRLLDELAVRSAPMPSAAATLVALRPHVALGVVSNFPEPRFVHDTLARFGLTAMLDVVVVSAEIGRMKPDPVPFRAAFDALGVDAADVLFVGDDLRSDMAGAAALGCRTAWMPLDPAAQLADSAPVDHRLHRLDDLLELLALA